MDKKQKKPSIARGRPRKNSDKNKDLNDKQLPLIIPGEYAINFGALDTQNQEIYSSIFQDYNAITINELREIAKRMGVKSATTMDKHTLVTAMSARRMANIVYCPPQQAAVAPVTYDEAEMLTDDYLMKTAVLDYEDKTGILEIASDGAWLRTTGFISDESDVFVPMLLVNDYRLESGDRLKGKARFMEKSGRFGFYKAENINGLNAAEFVRERLSQPALPSDIVRLDKGSRLLNTLNALCPVSKGQRKLIIGLGALKLDGLAREISRQLHEKGFLTINLFLDESPESMQKTADLPGSSLVLSCDSLDKYDDAIMLAVNYAKRIAPYGNDVALILNNADILDETVLRSVYGAGRYCENGSITTIIISSALELNPVINRLSRTSNSITIFKNNIGLDPLVDLKRSFSENENLLKKAEGQTLSDLRRQMPDSSVNIKDFITAYEILFAGNQKEEDTL